MGRKRTDCFDRQTSTFGPLADRLHWVGTVVGRTMMRLLQSQPMVKVTIVTISDFSMIKINYVRTETSYLR